ncbi:hypothetical protein G6F23_004691 [Rhizopus arrhizus]|nr:hypothetical protein G6F23_004691 [Rhizopus arrhizus]
MYLGSSVQVSREYYRDYNQSTDEDNSTRIEALKKSIREQTILLEAAEAMTSGWDSKKDSSHLGIEELKKRITAVDRELLNKQQEEASIGRLSSGRSGPAFTSAQWWSRYQINLRQLEDLLDQKQTLLNEINYLAGTSMKHLEEELYLETERLNSAKLKNALMNGSVAETSKGSYDSTIGMSDSERIRAKAQAMVAARLKKEYGSKENADTEELNAKRRLSEITVLTDEIRRIRETAENIIESELSLVDDDLEHGTKDLKERQMFEQGLFVDDQVARFIEGLSKTRDSYPAITNSLALSSQSYHKLNDLASPPPIPTSQRPGTPRSEADIKAEAFRRIQARKALFTKDIQANHSVGNTNKRPVKEVSEEIRAAQERMKQAEAEARAHLEGMREKRNKLRQEAAEAEEKRKKAAAEAAAAAEAEMLAEKKRKQQEEEQRLARLRKAEEELEEKKKKEELAEMERIRKQKEEQEEEERIAEENRQRKARKAAEEAAREKRLRWVEIEKRKKEIEAARQEEMDRRKKWEETERQKQYEEEQRIKKKKEEEAKKLRELLEEEARLNAEKQKEEEKRRELEAELRRKKEKEKVEKEKLLQEENLKKEELLKAKWQKETDSLVVPSIAKETYLSSTTAGTSGYGIDIEDEVNFNTIYRAKALYEYQGIREDDLSFSANEIIKAHPSKDKASDWWYGTSLSTNQIGFFPRTYVEVVEEAFRVRSLYEFAKVRPDDLGFSENEVIVVQPFQDEASGWWYGTNEETKESGYFPKSYVEVIDSAKPAPSISINTTSLPMSIPLVQTPVSIHSNYNSQFSREVFLQVNDYDTCRGLSAPNTPVMKKTGLGVNKAELTKRRRAASNVSTTSASRINTPTLVIPRPDNISENLELLTWASTMDEIELQAIPLEERQRQEAIFELITTERTYLNDLQMIVNVFYTDSGKYLTQDERDVVFSNIDDLLICNTALLSDMETRQREQANVVDKIGDIFLKHANSLKCYSTYCQNQSYASKFLQKKREEDQWLEVFLKTAQTRIECRSLDFSHFLLEPVQRITRYPLLLRQILNSTPKKHPDYALVKSALSVAQNILEDVNEETRRFENHHKMNELSRIIDMDGAQWLNLPNREFIMDGVLALEDFK